MDWFAGLGQAIYFAWLATLALPSVLKRPGTLAVQLYHVLVGGLPLATTAGIVIGAVFWAHLGAEVRRYALPGATQFLPQGLALAVVLELGPLTAGLLTAGRSGASLGAEIGSMRLTEQVEALEVLGRSPLRELVAPRLAACMLALPILTIFICYLAIGAGYVSEMMSGGMSTQIYLNEAQRLLRLDSAIPSLLKTVLFGWLIGLVGCYQGLTAQGGTEGVGNAATRAVVVSIFVVLIANLLLVPIIRLLLP